MQLVEAGRVLTQHEPPSETGSSSWETPPIRRLLSRRRFAWQQLSLTTRRRCSFKMGTCTWHLPFTAILLSLASSQLWPLLARPPLALHRQSRPRLLQRRCCSRVRCNLRVGSRLPLPCAQRGRGRGDGADGGWAIEERFGEFGGREGEAEGWKSRSLVK